MVKKRECKEGEISLIFGLKKTTEPTSLMKDWLGVRSVTLSEVEQYIFENILASTSLSMSVWSEEYLKMKFISFVSKLARLTKDKTSVSIFDKHLTAKVSNYKLSVKTNFVIASGLRGFMQKPYFRFQECSKCPSSEEHKGADDSMAQLLAAFLIAQTLNDDRKPLYGCEVNRAEEGLLQFIAILRKSKHILETELLD